MRYPWRIILPALHGTLALGLFLWQGHNEHVIASMGMAWDTGPPVWPYEAPGIFVVIINVPAILVGRSVNLLVGMRTFGEWIPINLVAVVLFWSILGAWIDGRFRPFRDVRIRVRLGIALMSAIICACVGLISIWDALRWWSLYGEWSLGRSLVFARIASATPWCAVIMIVAIKYLVSQMRQSGPNRAGPTLAP